MKGIVIFFDNENAKYADEVIFENASARQKAENWAKSLNKEYFTISSETCITIYDLFENLKKICTEQKADYAIYSYKDLPFLNKELSEKIIENHTKYKSEYTFADGFPYGFAPEVIDQGTLGILLEMAKTTRADAASKKITRDCIFEFIKPDINNFEVETVLSQADWRLFRYAFHCGKKENYLQCKALQENAAALNKKISDFSAEELSELASKNPKILKTVPGYYDIQIADSINTANIYSPYSKAYEALHGKNPLNLQNDKNTLMDFEKFSALVDKIAAFSQKAVIGLSAFGEPFNHPELLKFIEKVLSYDGLSVFIETDGLKVSNEFCSELKKLVDSAAERTNGWQKVMISVSVDAVSDEMYKKIKNTDLSIETVLSSVNNLCVAIPECVYPQFVRINDNESELESFFRYWNDKNNCSAGNFIIEKYNDFSKLLPECKPADLAPLDRNVCWHLRRNVTILTNGDVPLCKNCVLGCITGNVFEEELETLWEKFDSLLDEHINENYCERCKNCDEYYTFDF